MLINFNVCPLWSLADCQSGISQFVPLTSEIGHERTKDLFLAEAQRKTLYIASLY
jgi:hypothetical protein